MKKNISIIMSCILAVGLISGCSKTWTKIYGGSSDDAFFSVQQTMDGGYILAGLTYSYGAGLGDFWLIKTNANGIKQWNKTFGGSSEDWAYSVQQTKDGGFILAGVTYSYGAGAYDAWLIKTDTNGETCDYSVNGNCYENESKWVKTFGGSNWDRTSSVHQTKDGGYILAGYTTSYGAGSYDAWLIKTDTNGETCDYSSDGNCYENESKWVKTFGGSDWEDYDVAYSVQETSDGGYILAGETTSYGAGSYDAWFIKTDAKGNEQWDKTFGGSDWDVAYSVQETSDGGYILAGGIDYYGVAHYAVGLIKTDANGKEQWNKTFGDGCDNEAYSVQETSDGGYILAGKTCTYQGAWIIKTDASGETCDYSFPGDCYENESKWVKIFFRGIGDSEAWSVQQTKDGGYILAGYTKSYGAGSYDAWFIKTDAKGNAPPTPTP
jgi:hypothetical protein